MSLGWQTESALLPSKAKPINVDNKSLLSLKAIVLEKEQKQLAKKDSLSSSTHYNRFKTPIIASQNRENDKSSYKGKEEGYNQEKQDTSDEYKAKLALEAKAKIYDEMMKKVTLNPKDEILNPTLVDFSAKSNQDKLDVEESERIIHIPPDKKPKVTSEYSSNQWQWSTSNPLGNEQNSDSVVENWRKEEKDSRDFKRIVDQKIQEEVNQGVSQGARIKSQWEKGFDSHTKDILEAIHQETNQLREQQKKEEINDNAVGVGSKRSLDSMANNTYGSSTGHGNGANSREERLEMIKRKRELLLQQQLPKK